VTADSSRAVVRRAATGARTVAHRTFRSLYVRNYRLYFVGQAVSLTGTWMQSIAQAWLILQLTHSGVAIGATLALQFGPVLLLGPWGGVVADRRDKRLLLVATQSAMAMLALTLGLLVVTGVVRPWMVFALAGALGLVTAFDNPARQSFVIEMVGPADVPNAVSLNSVLMNVARIFGPAIAGALIATVGTGPCFLVNAGSYLGVIAALWLMRPDQLRPAERTSRGRGQLREGLRYAIRTPELRRPLLLMAVVGTFGFNFSTLLPLFATHSIHAGAGGFGALFSVMGLGAVAGGLAMAFRGRATDRLLVLSALLFGGALALIAAAPDLPLALLAMLPSGVANTLFISNSNSLLQERAAPSMRGRVMSLWAVVFLGTTPIGAPLVGWVAEALSPRAALALAGLLVAAAATGTGVGLRRASRVRLAPDRTDAAIRPLEPAAREA
jgi:MFS family permease